MPNIRLYYAVKALYSEDIIKAMIECVDGFDVASLSEINSLISFGVDPKKLNFSNPVKSPESIRQAYKQGITQFTFQSLGELKKIQDNAPKSSVYVRVKMDDSHSLVPLSEKFGCTRSEAIPFLQHAKEIGLKPIGIAFHIGSQLLDNTIWTKSITSANLMVKEAQEVGVEITHINIGGGFPARYFESDLTIGAAADYVNNALDRSSGVEYIAEPGRFIVADSSVIGSKVIGIEERSDKRWLFIDTGLFQSFLGAKRYDQFPYQPIALFDDTIERRKPTRNIPYIITGPSCDSQDVVAEDILLPDDIEVGDFLAFPNTGAYTIVYGSNFNGFSIPTQHYIREGKML
jgi:ornithine decarboxylase